MPYGKFVKKGNKVDVYRKSGGKAFTAHTPSKAEAHRIAGLREAAEKGKLRAARKGRSRR